MGSWMTTWNTPMSEGQKIAAWTAFGAIGGGALNVLFNWLFCLALNAARGGDHFEADPLRSFALGAICCGTAIGGSLLWQMKRRWWAAIAMGVGYAMLGVLIQ